MAGQRPLSEEKSRKKQDFAQWRILEKRRVRRRIAAYRVGGSKFLANRQRSELRLLLRRGVRRLAIPDETPIRCLGRTIAEFIAHLGAIRLALLA